MNLCGCPIVECLKIKFVGVDAYIDQKKRTDVGICPYNDKFVYLTVRRNRRTLQNVADYLNLCRGGSPGRPNFKMFNNTYFVGKAFMPTEM